MPEIGLFPPGLVLLPGERVPLHIFEERYKELINEASAAAIRKQAVEKRASTNGKVEHLGPLGPH